MQLAAHRHVVFAALFLIGHHRLIAFVEMFRGNPDEVEFPPGEVVKEALRRNARAIIAARNEPTGDPTLTPLACPPPGPWHCHARERRQIDLGVDHGRVETAMAQEIGNRLERCAALHQVGGQLERSLYAAFNTKTGEVLGKTAARHTSAESVAFLTDIVVNQPRGKDIHVIADNLSTHKTDRVAEFLDLHRNVHLHFTPTYSSWLNQVELWFGKIERDVIARGVFTSVADLKRKLMRYIRHYNKAPRTVKWKYADPSRQISTQSVGTGH
jgi:transposase